MTMLLQKKKTITSVQSVKKPQQDFFKEIDKFILKLMWKRKGPKTAKMTQRQARQEPSGASGSQTGHRAVAVRRGWCHHKDRHRARGDETELETDPRRRHLSSDKVPSAGRM